MENPNKQVEIWLFTYVFAVYCIKLLTILVAVVPTVTSAAAVEVDVVAVIINKCYSDSRWPVCIDIFSISNDNHVITIEQSF